MTTASEAEALADAAEAREARDRNQLTRADLEAMSPHQIEAARVDGRLNRLLGMTTAETDQREASATAAFPNLTDIDRLARIGRHDLIEAARAEGRIRYTTKEN